MEDDEEQYPDFSLPNLNVVSSKINDGNDCGDFLNTKSLSGTIVENALEDAHQVLLDAIGPLRGTTETESLLTPLDDILKDIYEIKADVSTNDLSGSSLQNNSNFEDSGQHFSFFETNLSQNYVNTTNPREFSFNSSGYQGDNSYVSLDNIVAQNLSSLCASNLADLYSGFQATPAPPPTPSTPQSIFEEQASVALATPYSGVDPSMYLNFTYDHAQNQQPTPFSPIYQNLHQNVYNPYYASIQAPIQTLTNAHIGNPLLPKYFTPRVVTAFDTSEERPENKNEINKLPDQPEPIVQSPEYIIEKPPLANKKTAMEAKEAENHLELELSAYYDTSNIVIPVVKEHPRTENGQNRRKQKLCNLPGNEMCLFEDDAGADLDESKSEAIKPETKHTENRYSESDLPEIDELFKRKKRFSNNRKDKMQPADKKPKLVEKILKPTAVVVKKTTGQRDSYPKKKLQKVQVVVAQNDFSTDSDSDDIPLKDMKSLKCSSCGKIFKTPRSLAIHWKRCASVKSFNETIKTIEENESDLGKAGVEENGSDLGKAGVEENGSDLGKAGFKENAIICNLKDFDKKNENLDINDSNERKEEIKVGENEENNQKDTETHLDNEKNIDTESDPKEKENIENASIPENAGIEEAIINVNFQKNVKIEIQKFKIDLNLPKKTVTNRKRQSSNKNGSGNHKLYKQFPPIASSESTPMRPKTRSQTHREVRESK